MERNRFPSPAGDLPFADRMPRLEQRPEGAPPPADRPSGGGCGNGCGNGCGGGCHGEGTPESGGGCVGHEGCGEHSWGLAEHPLAMVYAPCQQFYALYDPATALSRGTLFTELDLPLGGEGGSAAVGCAFRAERRRV